MPQQTNIVAKADEPELSFGTVIWRNRRYGFARCDGGPDVYLGEPELARAGISLVGLKIGLRLCFEVRKATHGRKPWAARIRLAEAPA